MALLPPTLRRLLQRPRSILTEKYSQVATDDHDDDVSHSSSSKPSRPHRWGCYWTRRRIVLAVVAAFLFTQILFATVRKPDLDFPYTSSTDLARDKARMRVLIPANSGDFELCKLMLAFSVLGYPTPHLVNWGMVFKDDPKRPFDLAGGSHLAKISGVIKWLWALEHDQMDDLVMIVDAYDVTPQLPPEVMLNQYYRTNREWNAHMAAKPGMRRAMREHGIYQTVVFAADKRCSPQLSHEPWCYLQPLSPLPEDLYGNRTDTEDGWEGDGRQAFRPRWLNSGVVLGPARDVLTIFTRAHQQMAQQRFGSDQSLFNLVFGEQEYMREYWRQQSLKWYDGTPVASRISDWIPRHRRIKARDVVPTDIVPAAVAPALARRTDLPHPTNLTGNALIEAITNPFNPDHSIMEPAFDRQNTEYHMGIDYWSSLSKTDVSAIYEIRQLTFNTTPPTGNLYRDPRDCHQPDPVLLHDLTTFAPPPFPSDFPAPEDHPAPPKRWADCSLFTDICSREIPSHIHHNGAKMNREFQWVEMWYHRYLKTFWEYRKAEAKAALETSFETGLPSPDINDGSAWNGNKKLGLSDVCGISMNMVFHGCMWGHGWDCSAAEIAKWGAGGAGAIGGKEDAD